MTNRFSTKTNSEDGDSYGPWSEAAQPEAIEVTIDRGTDDDSDARPLPVVFYLRNPDGWYITKHRRFDALKFVSAFQATAYAAKKGWVIKHGEAYSD